VTRQRLLFPGKACVYCGDNADTRDHIPPRCLLEKPYPANLPTVPSCRSCNNGFAADEEYFHVVLAQVGFVPTLTDRVAEGGVVDRTLEHSPGLDELLARSLAPGPDGRVWLTPDTGRLNRVAGKVAVGLFRRRYRRPAHPSSFSVVGIFHVEVLPPQLVVMTHTERFVPKRWVRLQPGVFEYLFVREPGDGSLLCLMSFHHTLWAAVRCPNPTGKSSG
jgi:hypothetical protein